MVDGRGSFVRGVGRVAFNEIDNHGGESGQVAGQAHGEEHQVRRIANQDGDPCRWNVTLA